MYLDISEGSKEKIVVFEGDNLEELTKITLAKDGSYIDLTGLTCDMAYTDVNSENYGDILENLTISNAEKGEIELSINSNLTKKDGVYDCEFRLSNSKGYVKYTAFFSLIVKENIFNKIGNKILSNNSFSKIKDILDRADKLKQDLSNAETTLSSLDSSNLAAKENIKNLQDNSNKAIELNKTLTSNVDSVDSKNKVLQDSIKAAEDFAKTLKGGTDFVQMRKDIDTLENNLKDTQSLSYSGSDITCKNSLAGRTSNMKLYGRTLQNVIKIPDNINENGIATVGTLITMVGNNSYPTLNYKSSLFKPNTKYTLFVDVKELNNIDNTAWCLFRIGEGDGKVNTIVPNPTSIGLYKVTFTTPSSITMADTFMRPNANGHTVKLDKLRIIEGEIEYVDYFEGVKNVGNKINILSSNNTDNKAPNYKECIKTITLPQGQEFNGLKDVQDTIEETSRGVEYTQNIGKIVLNGTEDWIMRISTDKTLKFILRNSGRSPHENDISIFANYPINIECYNNDIEGIFKTSDGFYLSIKKSKLETQDVEGLKKYLQSNPITTYYQLAEPKTYILKGIEETDIDTYNNVTYIKSLNTIPAAIDFSICTNYGSLLMQHSAEINKIWDTIYNIVYPILTENAVEISKVQAKNLLN